MAYGTPATIEGFGQVLDWLAKRARDESEWRLERPDEGLSAIVHDARARLAVISAGEGVPEDIDAVLVIGTGPELAAGLERLPHGRVQCLTLPCVGALLERTVIEAVAAAHAFAQVRLADRLLEVGIALNLERDPGRLLELILDQALRITGSDAGSIYLVETDRKHLRFKTTKNDSVDADFSEFSIPVTESSIVGTCVLTGQVVNIPDLYVEGGAVALGRAFKHDRSFDERFGYETRSMITTPMRPPGGKVLGVIQLINAKVDTAPLAAPEDFAGRVVPFSADDERLCLSLAAQGAVALENARLYAEIQALFDGFVHASVHAIEQRDPTTSGHSQRVADLTLELAHAVHRIGAGPFASIRFTDDQLREIKYAGLLHDFGKVGVREEVLVKAKKLYPQQLELVMGRFDHMRSTLQLELLEQLIERARRGRSDEGDLRAEHERKIGELDRMLKLVLEANEPSVVAEETSALLREVAQVEYRDTRNRPVRLLEDEEMTALLVRRGTLTETERVEIQSHAMHTYNFLVKIPWGQSLKQVPDIAGRHHEYLDGSGYPFRIGPEAIPIQTRMMTVADIFDALTASDRPYKKAVPVGRALEILGYEAKAGKIDSLCLELFIGARVYERIGLSL